MFGWRTPGTLDPDTPVLDVAAAVLGTGRASRLYRAVREKKLASSVSAYDYTPTALGVFVVHAETRAGDHRRGGAGDLGSAARSCACGAIDDDELTRVRRIFEARWVRRLETGRPRQLSRRVAGARRLGAGRRLLQALPRRVGRRYRSAWCGSISPEEKAASLIYRPESAPLVAHDAADMKRILGEGGSPSALPSVPRRTAPKSAAAKPAAPRRRKPASRCFAPPRVCRCWCGGRQERPMASIAVFIARRCGRGRAGAGGPDTRSQRARC